ncbi:hypothetical protein Q9R30_15205 [Arthrobacter sp. AB6]|uniref:hypothetical protein n=1 Tax=Arthrobacter sp. AB6 TaxID=2962570 RepID=UPI002882B162|nr:hypothetical protein [Arthrobacter sp. AB6]MDT0196703.1 hypothetical protein [Arthrobacter sp. AB6]
MTSVLICVDIGCTNIKGGAVDLHQGALEGELRVFHPRAVDASQARYLIAALRP